MHRLRPNSFQITTLIVFEFLPLGAGSYTHHLQVFIFASWSSPPVTASAGRAAHEVDILSLKVFFFFFFLCMIYESSQRRESRQGRLWLSMVGVWASAAFQMSVIRRHRLRHVDYHRLLRNYQPGISMSGECAKIISHNSERTWMALLSIKVSHGGIEWEKGEREGKGEGGRRRSKRRAASKLSVERG